LFGDGCACPICAGEIEGDRAEFGCEYEDIAPVAVTLYRAYITYLEPPSISSYTPHSHPRASLMDLPYRMHEVAQMVDMHRLKSQTEQHREREELTRTREMMRSAGIPL